MNDIKVGRVWIIDDDEVIKYLTEMMFKQVEFCEQSTYFQNAEIAMEEYKNAADGKAEFPDLILLDLTMPGFDGWTFLEEMHRIRTATNVPVFIFTSSINENDIIRARSYPKVKDVITKPLTVHKINKILRQM